MAQTKNCRRLNFHCGLTSNGIMLHLLIYNEPKGKVECSPPTLRLTFFSWVLSEKALLTAKTSIGGACCTLEYRLDDIAEREVEYPPPQLDGHWTPSHRLWLELAHQAIDDTTHSASAAHKQNSIAIHCYSYSDSTLTTATLIRILLIWTSSKHQHQMHCSISQVP